jgi:hypothetical protein
MQKEKTGEELDRFLRHQNQASFFDLSTLRRQLSFGAIHVFSLFFITKSLMMLQQFKSDPD